MEERTICPKRDISTWARSLTASRVTCGGRNTLTINDNDRRRQRTASGHGERVWGGWWAIGSTQRTVKHNWGDSGGAIYFLPYTCLCPHTIRPRVDNQTIYYLPNLLTTAWNYNNQLPILFYNLCTPNHFQICISNMPALIDLHFIKQIIEQTYDYKINKMETSLTTWDKLSVLWPTNS